MTSCVSDLRRAVTHGALFVGPSWGVLGARCLTPSHVTPRLSWGSGVCSKSMSPSGGDGDDDDGHDDDEDDGDDDVDVDDGGGDDQDEDEDCDGHDGDF